ncbi:hypothetical protein D3C86_879960 [compost metagenome]
MIVYTLVKADFNHKQNIGTFSTLEKAQAFQAASEVELFDSGSLAGVSYFIEKVVVQ